MEDHIHEELEHEMMEAGNTEDIAGSGDEFTCCACRVEYIGLPSLNTMRGPVCCHCREAGTYDTRTCQHAFNPYVSNSPQHLCAAWEWFKSWGEAKVKDIEANDSCPASCSPRWEANPKDMEVEYLVELSHQLYARSCNLQCTKELHERSNELKAEILRRLQAENGKDMP